jgi:ubiquinone/menaquinone biosynthesis C-methylase UbiE
VLDVAAGTGEQTLMASRRVGPDGSVLATDIAARMLAGAAEAARQAGLANVETRLMDARSLELEPGSFDAAISRFALMLIPERGKALAGIRRALKPGKRFAAAVLSRPEKSARIALPLAIARRHAGLPPAPLEDPGMFALGDPAVLRAAFEQAGFREVAVESMGVERRFPSLAAAVQDCRDSLPEIAELTAELSEAERGAAWAEIEAELRQFERPDGVVLLQEYLIAVGTP